ncbi:iron ABC transporter permease [Fusibacter sp. 3D3]|uniref:FecCD family ABC transporter permease n=1 Tax=Fusibacter sp. 3D3 TaxID=1048380 RepID=UPI000852EBD9|nr:iron ABC transporter permease [Fusibacter sp. 3D3]GAU75919.1 vitamin B12 ABC transporter permease component BtuC [Fusibacter sp. 3D3]
MKSEKILNSHVKFASFILVLIVVLIFTFFYSITMGSVDISVNEIGKIIANKVFRQGIIDDIPRSIQDIIWEIRLPRIVLALFTGIGLSISGVIMQAIVKNPLADPYILGISSGASLGATLAIMLGVGAFFGSNFVGVSAFLMAFLVSLMVLALANVRGKSDAIRLLLSGMAMNTMCSAISSFIIYTSSDREGMRTVAFWLMGSFSGANWNNLKLLMPVILMALVFFLTQKRTLNVMLLGDEVAVTLGKKLTAIRHLYLLLISAMMGFLVFNAGIIGFVGLIMPHLTRLIVGTDHNRVLPTVALLGAILLIWADVISRIIITGSELPVGIIISLVGAPCFIYLMIKSSYGFGGA